MKQKNNISKTGLKKIAIVVLMAVTTIGAFATLGTPGRGNSSKAGKSLLTGKTSTSAGTFSLRSGYSFRGSNVITATKQDKFISLNTVVTYQQGHTTYLMPLKKKVALNGKLTFNPNAATR